MDNPQPDNRLELKRLILSMFVICLLSSLGFSSMLAFMRQAQTLLHIPCQGRGMMNITSKLQAWLAETGLQTGQVTVFVQHTSCSLMIQENADPDVLTDMETFLAKLVLDGDPAFLHRDEGDDDMAAHIRTALTQTSLTIPVKQGRAALGTWQGLFLYEHRYEPMQRRVLLNVIGE